MRPADWDGPGTPIYTREQSVTEARPMVQFVSLSFGGDSARWPEPHDRHEIVTPNIGGA